MRADRLIATLLLLQARGRVTAQDVADELEVSVATARRDLEALGAAGVPVYAQRGRGGGWALVGGARTDLTGLSAGEAQAVFLALGPAAGTTPQVAAALRKLLRALPATFRDDASTAAQAVAVDPVAWRAAGRAEPEEVAALRRAVVERQVVRLEYADRRGTPSERLVEPLGLVAKDGRWYLVAGTDDGRRTFRLDRVSAATPTGEHFERPDDFDLRAVWADVVDVVETRQHTVEADVRVAPHLAEILAEQFGRHGRVLEDGRVRVRAPNPLMIAQQLAGWGATVEVDDDRVRGELRRLGTELVMRNGPDDRTPIAADDPG